jgi:Predicted metal-binding protein related to the C-terminal domain of SecA
MIDLPVFCNSCGAIFPSGIVVENLTDKIDDISGSCPLCGEFGQVPSAIFNFIGHTIKLLTGPDKTIDELNKLSVILHNYQDKESGIVEIREQIKQEVPKLTSIADLLPETRQNIYQFIQIILFIITIIITLTLEGQQRPITAEIIVAQLYKHLTPSNNSPNDKNNLNFKVGRNELCTCGSGKKYKKCCGQVH